MKLYADAARFVSGLVSAEGSVRKFTGGVKSELNALKGAFNSVEGRLASIGVSVGAVATIVQSARMDKSLTQIGQTAGMSHAEVKRLRGELFDLAKQTGQDVDELQVGFKTAVQAGLSYGEAVPVIGAVNKAVAVTSASAGVLAEALTVAGSSFDFDLSKPGMALSLLDQMTVATDQGSAELESLADIISRVGTSAATAGMSFPQTLGFVEALSYAERAPRRLGTLVEATLRIFSNLETMKTVAKATGVRFFDKDDMRRDPVQVIKDIRAQYGKLNSDKARAIYLHKAFGQTDENTIKGLRMLFGGNMLDNAGKFTAAITGASGDLDRRLPEAIANSVDQVGRLKAALREAADGFVKPINDTLENSIKKLMDKKDNGGLGLDGKDMILGGGVAALALFGAARYGGKAVGALAKRFGGTAAGVAEGKALEAAAGVTPVYVVNMPGGGLASGVDAVTKTAAAAAVIKTASKFKVGAALLGGSNLSALRMMGAGALGTAGLMTTAAGAVGYGAGTLLNKYAIEGTAVGDKIGDAIAKTVAFFGIEEARRAVEMTEKLKSADVGGTIHIKIDSEGNGRVVSMQPSNRNVRFNIDPGWTMAGAN